MKILFANALYMPNVAGGAELALADMATGLQVRGHDCHVLTTHEREGVLRESVQGIPVIRIGYRNVYWGFPLARHSAAARIVWHAIDGYNLPMAAEAGKVMDEVQPDVLVCHNLAGLSVAVWAAARKRRIPIVQILHDYYSLCPKSTMFRAGSCCETQCGSCGFFRLPHESASRNVDAVVGVSEAVLKTHLLNGLFSRAKIKTVVHNARRVPEVTRVEDESRPFTFAYIGALTQIKGLRLLLESFHRVASKVSRPIRLLVAGKGEPAEEAHLKRDHESQSVRFVGYVKPAEFFAQVDVAVVPSLWNEPLGMVVFEAIASGVPVIGSTRGGIPEIVQHEINGLLFSPDDEGALDAAMIRVLEDGVLIASLRSSGRASVATFLEPELMLDRYERVFRQVIATPEFA